MIWTLFTAEHVNENKFLQHLEPSECTYCSQKVAQLRPQTCARNRRPITSKCMYTYEGLLDVKWIFETNLKIDPFKAFGQSWVETYDKSIT